MAELDAEKLKENALTSIRLGIEDFQRNMLSLSFLCMYSPTEWGANASLPCCKIRLGRVTRDSSSLVSAKKVACAKIRAIVGSVEKKLSDSSPPRLSACGAPATMGAR